MHKNSIRYAGYRVIVTISFRKCRYSDAPGGIGKTGKKWVSQSVLPGREMAGNFPQAAYGAFLRGFSTVSTEFSTNAKNDKLETACFSRSFPHGGGKRCEKIFITPCILPLSVSHTEGNHLQRRHLYAVDPCAPCPRGKPEGH